MNTTSNDTLPAGPDAPAVTIVITPRERFGVALESFQSIIEITDPGYDLVYIDAGSPAPVADKLAEMCLKNSFRYIRRDYYLSPNQARNLGFRAAQTPYIAFIDNDVIVSKGWLSTLLSRAEESDADVIVPLTCQKRPLHTEIHQAGGRITDDLQTFLSGPAENRRIVDEHILQGKKIDEVRLETGDTQCCEFHCVLVRRSALERTDGLDESLLATKEHLDFSLGVWQSEGRIVFEPESVVTYLFPNRQSPITRADWAFFTLRWSPVWQARSLAHFQEKWRLGADPYFANREEGLTWRHRLGIAMPFAASIPVLGRSALFRRLTAGALTRLLHLWSLWLIRQQSRQVRQTG